MDEQAASRVAIAQDTLKYLEKGAFRAKTGSYFETPDGEDFLFDGQGEELQEILEELEGTCGVCALGGLFYSAVRENNDFELPGRYINRADIVDRLIMFAPEQLALIEVAFEGLVMVWQVQEELGETDEEIVERALEIYRRDFESSEDRMKVIMENIVRNEGTFIP